MSSALEFIIALSLICPTHYTHISNDCKQTFINCAKRQIKEQGSSRDVGVEELKYCLVEGTKK